VNLPHNHSEVLQQVKDAHVYGVTCSRFRKYIMDFVDDELSEENRCECVKHADACPVCRRELHEALYLRKVLAGLPEVDVSPEFDFKLKSALRLEDSRLRSPYYRFKLLVLDNLAPIFAAPAVAVLLISGWAYYNGAFRDVASHFEVTERKSGIEPYQTLHAADDAGAEDVKYVLESLDLDQAGIEVSPRPETSGRQSNPNMVSLINF